MKRFTVYVSKINHSICNFPPSEDGSKFPGHYHDGDARWRRDDGSTFGSQNPPAGSSEAHLKVPTVLCFQDDGRTPTVTFTCQTCERADACTCQVQPRAGIQCLEKNGVKMF